MISNNKEKEGRRKFEMSSQVYFGALVSGRLLEIIGRRGVILFAELNRVFQSLAHWITLELAARRLFISLITS